MGPKQDSESLHRNPLYLEENVGKSKPKGSAGNNEHLGSKHLRGDC